MPLRPTAPHPPTAWARWPPLLAVLLLTAGCDTTDATAAEVRVVNATSVAFAAVALGFTGPPRALGPVEAGGASGYQAFETAYRYGYVRVETADGVLILQPIDYVGEAPLAPGRYSFRLTIEGGDLAIEAVED